MRTFAVFGFVIAALALSAQAQSTSSRMEAAIPFAFTFGRQTFPAGNYSLRQAGGVLALLDQQGRTIGMALTQDVYSQGLGGAPTLKFHAVAGQHILTEVWDRDGAGHQLYPVRQKHVEQQTSSASEAASIGQP